MNSYHLNPYTQIVENHIFPKIVQYGVFHRLTGEVIEPLPSVRALLLAMRMGSPVAFGDEDLARLGRDGQQLKLLMDKEILATEEHQPLSSFLDQYVVRPIQNPAVSYRSETGELIVVRTSMAQRIFSPAAEELPAVIEEKLEPEMAALFLAADGTQTLTEICEAIPGFKGNDLLTSSELRNAIDFLTEAKRQLIKFTRNRDDAGDPFRPCNITPRNMYPSSKADAGSRDVSDFHQHLIDDASVEFDFIEPTINHGLRFPNDALGGLSYGARFCVSALQLLPDDIPGLKILEVGGGTGSFAVGFIEEALKTNYPAMNYSIVDLSPALAASQKQRLASLGVPVDHFQQDATQLQIPNRKFDLIISNEVIADFPVSPVTRNGHEWEGAGAAYLQKYGLHDETAPSSFLLNTGAMEFLERAWEHLAPGGFFLVSEYGDEFTYPVQAYHLNHEEFSIHFGHLKRCAEEIGFQGWLIALKDFLNIDDRVSMLDGQEEQILCLNQIFKEHGVEALPFALTTEREFKAKYDELAKQIELTGATFSPLSNGFHFGPKLSQFMILVMRKPN